MKRIHHLTRLRRRLFAGATVTALVAAAPLSAQSGSCSQLLATSMKLYDAPYHMYMVDSAQTDARLNGGKPTVSEAISTGGVTYFLVRGTWRKSPIGPADYKKSQQDADAANKPTCTHVRDESVNGEAASVWHSHSVTEVGTSDTDMWISKSRNVLLKSDIRMDVGGNMGKSHIMSRYEYTNVRAPAGVH